MAWPAVLSGLLSAGGQAAAGYLGSQGGTKPSDMVMPYYNPYLDYGLQSTNFDALNQLGFGNINNIPDPLQVLMGRISAAPVDNKTKRRAMTSLQYISQAPDLLNDPYGTNFTRDEVLNANKTGDIPFGRVVLRGSEGGGTLGLGDSHFAPGNSPISEAVANHLGITEDTDPKALPVKNVGRLVQSLSAAGISLDDLKGTLTQREDFKAQIKRLNDAGLGQLNESTILNRAQAAQSAAGLLGDAGRFVNGGAAGDFQTSLYDRLQRNIKDQETATLLQAQYGGYNPGEALRGIQNMKQDSQITALTQAIQAANALTAGLNGGNSQAQSAAGMMTSALSQNAGIAAQQAAAANTLAAKSSINRADSLANGVAGGANQLGNTLLSSYLMNGNRPAWSGASYSGGPGSTANQLATQNSMFGY